MRLGTDHAVIKRVCNLPLAIGDLAESCRNRHGLTGLSSPEERSKASCNSTF
jgi:hypothetical protein